MGMWVILIGDSNLTVDRFQDMKFVGHKQILKTENGLDVIYENGSAHFYNDLDNHIAGDYERVEIERLPFCDIRMMMLKYSEIQILKSIIDEDDFPKDIYIDCDGLDLGLGDIIGQERLL